jgi:bifunctional non-homologous end joining protein LigD
MTPESVSLAFNDLAEGGSSDKVYHINLFETTHDGWQVTIQYGRRGAALMSQVKGHGLLYDKAKKLYDKIKREKMNKGYVIQGAPPAPQVAPSGVPVDIKPPELLEEVINGDHRKYVEGDAYWMQDKSDGVSRGVLKQGGEIFGINKQGKPVPLPTELVAKLARIPLDTFQIDAELVGSKLVCRDILVANEDISHEPYFFRFKQLVYLISIGFLPEIEVVQTWVGRDAKEQAIERQRAERREGVVFKLWSAPYRPGRNGQHKKYKFIKTLSAIAGPPGATGKESVDLWLFKHQNGGVEPVRCGTVSLIGKPAVKEGDVVEVAYLYAQPSGLLSQARLLHVRTDVAAEDCTTAQLIYKREEEA